MSSRTSIGEPVVVFTNPTSRPDYVREFIRAFWGTWNLRSVLLYPNDISRARIAQADAVIGHQGVAARYRGDLADLDSVARVLRAKHRVRAVVPQSEGVVLYAARLRDLLGTDGPSLAVASQFRDKYRLKESLRRTPDGPRVNLSAKVATPADAIAYVHDRGLAEFVLKPNDGCGNDHVAFFSRDAGPDDIASYFTSNQGAEVLLEEFIAGDEFCVNGQVSTAGEVLTYSVQRTEHRPANGHPNLAGGFRMMASYTYEFDMAAKYAAQVLSAIGLRGSPFHMEIKIGPDGPCLIECGARLGGAGIPFDTNLAHGGGVNLFTEAASCYLGLPGYRSQPDWEAYDSSVILTILGAASRDERIVQLRGVSAVEQLPEFVYWVRRPDLGQRLSRTTNLITSPWQVTLRGTSEPTVRAAARQVRQLIGWNPDRPRVMRVPRELRAEGAWLRRRAPMLGPLAAPGPARLRR